MTNDEYQKQAREQRAREDAVAAQRKWNEDYAASQRVQQERNSQAQRERISKDAGFNNWTPPMGGAYDPRAFRAGQEAGKAHRKMMSGPSNIFPSMPIGRPNRGIKEKKPRSFVKTLFLIALFFLAIWIVTLK